MTKARAIRLERVLAINMMIAWRIYLMILLGRESPDLPMELLFPTLRLKCSN